MCVCVYVLMNIQYALLNNGLVSMLSVVVEDPTHRFVCVYVCVCVCVCLCVCVNEYSVCVTEQWSRDRTFCIS